MPEIQMQHQCASLTGLIDVDSFGTPIGPLPRQTDASFFQQGPLYAGTISVGDEVVVIAEQLPKWLRAD